MTPARTSGTKHRPRTAAARPMRCASGLMRATRARIASSMVSGSRPPDAPDIDRSRARAAAISSSMCSGRPSLRRGPRPRGRAGRAGRCPAGASSRWRSGRGSGAPGGAPRRCAGSAAAIASRAARPRPRRLATIAPSTRSGWRSASRASSPMSSRLRSSAHWRSSKTSSVGRSIAARSWSTRSRTSVRL